MIYPDHSIRCIIIKKNRKRTQEVQCGTVLKDQLSQGGHFLFTLRPEKKTFRSCFLSSVIESCSVVSEKKTIKSKVNDDHGWTTENA